MENSKISLKTKIRVHLWTLPRWFAAPLFGAPAMMGGLLAGGMNLNAWLGVAATLLIMAGGHSFNTLLDYAWTGLDRGAPGERSVEKDYSSGQSVIASGLANEKEVAANALFWYALAFIPLTYLTLTVGWQVMVIGLLGMAVTFWYARAKFNWTHELALAVGSGVLPMLAGMYARSISPPLVQGLVVSVPFALLPSFIGLAIDEYPDAEANLKKGVKSLSYRVWQNGVSLEWYLSSWILFMYLYQIFLISLGWLAPLSAIAFITWPLLMGSIVMLKRDFRKWAGIVVRVGVFYPVLLVAGQAFMS